MLLRPLQCLRRTIERPRFGHVLPYSVTAIPDGLSRRLQFLPSQGIKHYNMKSKKGLEFFDTHMEADIYHSRVWRDILRKVTTNSMQNKVRKSFNASLDAQWAFLDGIVAKERMKCTC